MQPSFAFALRRKSETFVKMTFELVDLEELGQKAVQDFTTSMAEEREGRTPSFQQALGRLMAHVEFTYGVAAKLAHREPTMEGTVAVWSKMIAICDEAARQIKELEQQYPAGRTALDRILDYRNAAEKRRDLHA
jgi:hypothetical protein